MTQRILWIVAWVIAIVAVSNPVLGAPTVTYYHNDLLGSPVVATDSSGAVIWRESFRPYGERLTNDANAAANKMWFTSRRQDAETGLVYMGARFYDPVAGRFISMDPKGFDEEDLHSFNRYAYANNNPARFVDRDGRAPTPLDLAFVVWDLGSVIHAAATNGDVKGAAIDLGISAGSLIVPIPGVALAIKAERAAEAVKTAAQVGERGAEVLKTLKNGDALPTGAALDAAIAHLGPGYIEIAPGVFKSADGTRVVRMTDGDLSKIGNHSGAPHMNFETGRTVTKPNGKASFVSDENKHVFLPEER